MKNQQIAMKHLLEKDPTALYYRVRNFFREDVNSNNIRLIELDNSGDSTPSFAIVEFQARNKIDP